MIHIDQWAYTSKIKNIDPIEKVFFAILTLLVCLWANKIAISLLVIILMGGITVLKGRIPLLVFLKLMLLPMSFLLIGVVTIAVSVASANEAFLTSVHMGNVWVGVTSGGLITAAKLFFKALGATACLYYLSLSTPLVDFLQAFLRMKVPKLLVELMGLIYKFIFVLLETADHIFTAQHARLGYSNLKTGYKSLGKLIAMLFIRAYKRSDELYSSLEARGYDGELNVLHENYNKRWQGYAFACLMNGLLIALTFYMDR